MSWARFGCEGSDVYLFPTSNFETAVGECCGCQLPANGGGRVGDFTTQHLDVMLAHLDQHRAAGQTVPDSAYEQVRAEWSEYMG